MAHENGRDTSETSFLLNGQSSPGGESSDPIVELRKQDLLIELTKSLVACGSPIYRLEKYMATVAEAIGLPVGRLIVLHETLLAGFKTVLRFPGGRTADIATTSFHNVSGQWNMEKLEEITQLIVDMKNGEISIETTEKRLQIINEKRSTFADAVSNFVAFPTQAAFSSILFFGGNWLSLALTFPIGLLLGVIQCLPSLSNVLIGRGRPFAILGSRDFTVLLDFFSAAAGSFAARILSYYFTGAPYDQCFGTLLMGSIVFLLPGLELVESVLEVATGNTISGVAKWSGAVVQIVLIASNRYHTILGVFDKRKRPESRGCAHVGTGFDAMFLHSCQMFVVQQWRQVPISVVTGMMGWFVNGLVGSVSGYETSSFASAFAVGVISNLYAKMLERSSSPPDLCGVLTIVPGSLGLQGVLGMWKDAPGIHGKESTSEKFVAAVLKVTMSTPNMSDPRTLMLLPSELIRSILVHLPLRDLLRSLFVSLDFREIALPVALEKVRDFCLNCDGMGLALELFAVYETQNRWGRRGLGRFVSKGIAQNHGTTRVTEESPYPHHLLPPAQALIAWDILRTWRTYGGDRLLLAWSTLPPPQTFERGWRVFAPFLSGLNLPLVALTRVFSFAADESAGPGIGGGGGGLSQRMIANRAREAVADLSGLLTDMHLAEDAVRHVWWRHTSASLGGHPLRFLGHSSTIFPNPTSPESLIPTLIWLSRSQNGRTRIPGLIIGNMGWARGTVAAVARAFCGEIVAGVRSGKCSELNAVQSLSYFIAGVATDNVSGSLGRTITSSDVWSIVAALLESLLDTKSYWVTSPNLEADIIPMPQVTNRASRAYKEMAIAVFDRLTREFKLMG
ncbi:hypothetical protein HDU93_005946 [Gonapodya sp. JEL0774]|nr:hypothetical protein HDU93_005946 [Gonapodya sp. JEL0774]